MPNLGLYSVTFNNDLEHDLARSNASTSSATKPSARDSAISSKSSIPTSPGAVEPDDLADLSSTTRSRGRWPGSPRRAVRFSEDRVSRPEGDGGARAVRPAPDRRHPRRLCRHDPRRVPASARRPEVRGRGGSVRAEDQQRREPAGVRRVPAADRRRRWAPSMLSVIMPSCKLGIKANPRRRGFESPASRCALGGIIAATVPRMPEPAPVAEAPHECKCHGAAASNGHATNGKAESNGYPVFSDGRPSFSRMERPQRLASSKTARPGSLKSGRSRHRTCPGLSFRAACEESPWSW